MARFTNDQLSAYGREAVIKGKIYNVIKNNDGLTSDKISLKTEIDKSIVLKNLCELKDDGFINIITTKNNVYYFIDKEEKPLEDYETKPVPRRKHEFIEFVPIGEFAKIVSELTGKTFSKQVVSSVKTYKEKFDAVKSKMPDIVSVVKTNVCNNKNMRYEPSVVLIVIKNNQVFGYNLGSLLEIKK